MNDEPFKGDAISEEALEWHNIAENPQETILILKDGVNSWKLRQITAKRNNYPYQTQIMHRQKFGKARNDTKKK